MFKELHIDDAIRRDPKLAATVERATRYLEEEAPIRTDRVVLHWSLVESDDEALVRVTADHERSGQAERVFPRLTLETASDSILRLLVMRLWGDLLRSRTRIQLLKVKEMGLLDDDDE